MIIKPNRQERQSEEQTVNAPCESPANESRVSTSGESRIYELNAKELKSQVSFRKLLERNGKEVIEAAGRHRCMCPFHKDTGHKFYIWSNDSGGQCFGCEWKGDIYAYIMQHYEVGFGKAVEILDMLKKDILRNEEGVE
jgi:DNA primase